LMHYLLNEHVELTLATFFGLILASGFVVARSVEQWNSCKAAWVVVGACFAYWLVALPVPKEVTDSLGYLFVCGMVGICAMILPGISGAFILLIMGCYEHITGIIKSLLHGEVTGENILELVVFAGGCLVGLLSFSKFLRWLLARYHGPTMAVLCGFIIGSLRRVWPFKQWPDEGPEIKSQYTNILPESFDEHVALALALAVVAIVFVIFLDWISRREQDEDAA
jgi:putative membrane protein